MNGAAQSMDGNGSSGDGHWRASLWETATAVARSRWTTAMAAAAVAQLKASWWYNHDARQEITVNSGGAMGGRMAGHP